MLDDLIVRAGAGSTGLSPEEIEAAVRPITQLLNLIGDSGAERTAAGYLKPALVEQLAQRTGVTTWWIGKANREDHTPPIAALRSAAQSLGLVRKQRQRLLLTAAGRRARGDPAALWEVLVAGLPVGRRPEQRQAGLLALLTVAAGRPAYPLNEGTEVMRYLGWHNDVGQITPEAVYHFARRTLEVLEALDPAEYRVLPGSAAALARAALRPALPVG